MLEVEKLDAVADRGYFNSEEILACEEAGITATRRWTRRSHPTRTRGSRCGTAFRSFGSMFRNLLRESMSVANPAATLRVGRR
jgi:hypothetical protein